MLVAIWRTSTRAKSRFVFLHKTILPDHAVFAITRDDEATFGILHSRFHELWALRLGTSLEDRPRYTPTTTFETFPFPEGLTPDIPALQSASEPHAVAIAETAHTLNELREHWLNPPELVTCIPEVASGFPDRAIPVNAEAATQLKQRTLTNLYNKKPAWLLHAHQRLDDAVAAAYGWEKGITDDDVLSELLKLNAQRATMYTNRSFPASSNSASSTKKGPAREHGPADKRKLG